MSEKMLRVTDSRRYTKGRWFVRTTRHDHYRPATDTVQRTQNDLRLPRSTEENENES